MLKVSESFKGLGCGSNYPPEVDVICVNDHVLVEPLMGIFVLEINKYKAHGEGPEQRGVFGPLFDSPTGEALCGGTGFC